MRAASVPAVVLMLLTAGACSARSELAGTGPRRQDDAGAWRGDTLRLPLGATAAVGVGARLTFAARGDDSRCPVNVQCVWEGDAAITVRVSGGATGATRDRVLHTSGRVGVDTVTAGGMRVRLVGLLPERREGEERAPGADVTALLVAVRP